MKVNEDSILAVMNPFCLLGAVLLVCLAAWGCVYRYRNTNDFKKSLKCYIPLLFVLDAIFIFGFQLDIILTVGVDLCGIIVLALISNHYFYR